MSIAVSLVIGAGCGLIGFALGWVLKGKLAPKLGAIETKVATLEKDVKAL
jgi:hypothetical protein